MSIIEKVTGSARKLLAQQATAKTSLERLLIDIEILNWLKLNLDSLEKLAIKGELVELWLDEVDGPEAPTPACTCGGGRSEHPDSHRFGCAILNNIDDHICRNDKIIEDYERATLKLVAEEFPEATDDVQRKLVYPSSRRGFLAAVRSLRARLK